MGKIRKKWSDTELIKALADIRSGKSISGISKSSGIPKSTLISKLKGYRPIGKRSGPPPIFSVEEEEKIVHWMLHLSQRGFPVTKTQLLYNASHLIKHLHQKTPFTDGRPGRRWYEAFLRRHPEISTRIAQNLSKSRASVTEDILRGWFKEIEKHLSEKQLKDIDGARIFNCDESAFYLCPKGEHVLVRKGDNKAVYNFTQNDEKECLTVLFMTNATGTLVPPMILFPYKRIPYSISQSVPTSWAIGKSENGWMTAETFYEYISNIFEPWLTAQNIERPIILYVDGHSSHMTLPLAEFCMNHQIELIALFPNATHLIHPLDVALFRTLKSKWKDCVNDWRMQNQRNFRREDFSPLLKIAIEHVELSKVMKNGFRKCGLFPFSADALQYNQLLQKKKHDTTVTSESEQNVENYLLFIERNIDKDLLSKFRHANKIGIYDDNLENLGLFFFWQKILKLSRGCNTTDSNSMDSIDILVVSDPNLNLNSSISNEICALKSNLDVASDLHNSVHQDMKEKENISLLKNSEDNSMNEVLFYPSLQFTDDSIDAEANNVLQIVETNEMIPTDPLQIDLNEDTMIENEASNANVYATEATQSVLLSTINDNDCLDVPSDIPDVFKKTLFWPRTNNSAAKKRAVKVKVPSVATSVAWQEYHRAKETEKSQRLIAVEERKRKRQEMAEKKKTRSRGKEKAKNVATSRKSYQKK